MSDVRYSMKAVSQRTGLSPHVLRVWERRYQAVTPERSDTNRRLYSEEEAQRLEYLALLTEAGHAISHIASLPTKQLASMAVPLQLTQPTAPRREDDDALVEEAWTCVIDLDSSGLHNILERASVSLGVSKLCQAVIVPLIERIGMSWETGDLSPAEEHAASAVIKEVLFATSRPFAESSGAPNLLVATPSGQLHELGAVLVSSIARRDGWNVTYLGPSLPATEIARAAIQNQSRAVGLSIVYPADDASLPEELIQLRRDLPKEVDILVGGRAIAGYADTCNQIGATIITTLPDLTEELRTLRTRGPA